MTGNAVKHKGWMDITEEGAAYSSTMKSIWQFCQRIETDRVLYDRIDKEISESGVKDADFLSFFSISTIASSSIWETSVFFDEILLSS